MCSNRWLFYLTWVYLLQDCERIEKYGHNYRICPLCLKSYETGGLVKHIRLELKARKITEHDWLYYSNLSSEMCQYGVRACTEEEVLDEFPLADAEFMEKLNRLLRRKSVIIIDTALEPASVPARVPIRQTPTEGEGSNNVDKAEDTKSHKAADYYAALELPPMENTLIEKLFERRVCPEDVSQTDMEKNRRKFKQFRVNLRRHLGWCKTKQPNLDEWKLLASVEGLNLVKSMYLSKAVAPTTMLTHAKLIKRILKLAREQWFTEPGYPQDRAAYFEEVDTAINKWSEKVSSLEREAAKHIQKNKDTFIKKGKLPMEDIRRYFYQDETMEQIMNHFETLEKYAQENNNIVSLGEGMNYDRALALVWNKVVRFLGMSMQVYTKRLSTLQGLKLEEFRNRQKVEGGFFVSIEECKNADNSSDGFLIPTLHIGMWERYYKLRLMCRKSTAFDREEMFINICGKKFTKFTEDINRSFPDKAHSINGRNIRRVVCTSGKQLDKSKRPDFLSFVNHGDGVDKTVYQCPTAEECAAGQQAVAHVGQMDKICEVVTAEIDKLCKYSTEVVFPDILTAEDIIRESFQIKIKQMDKLVYEKLHDTWQKKFLPAISKDMAMLARRRDPKSFDAMFVLQTLRQHAEWMVLRGEIREEAELIFKSLNQVRGKKIRADNAFNALLHDLKSDIMSMLFCRKNKPKDPVVRQKKKMIQQTPVLRKARRPPGRSLKR